MSRFDIGSASCNVIEVIASSCSRDNRCSKKRKLNNVLCDENASVFNVYGSVAVSLYSCRQMLLSGVKPCVTLIYGSGFLNGLTAS